MRFQNADCSVFCPFNLYDYGLSQPTKHGPNGTVNSSQWPGSKACGQVRKWHGPYSTQPSRAHANMEMEREMETQMELHSQHVAVVAN